MPPQCIQPIRLIPGSYRGLLSLFLPLLMSSTMYLYGSVNRCHVQHLPGVLGIGISLEMSQRFKSCQSIAGNTYIKNIWRDSRAGLGQPHRAYQSQKKSPPPSRGGDGRPIAKGGDGDGHYKKMLVSNVSVIHRCSIAVLSDLMDSAAHPCAANLVIT